MKIAKLIAAVALMFSVAGAATITTTSDASAKLPRPCKPSLYKPCT